MLPRTYDQITCSIARCLEVLGDRWTLLVVRNALVGMTRFDDFQRNLGLAPNVLSDRLARLCQEGVLERVQYADRPVRHEYVPTAKGRELWSVLTAMLEWGDRYYAPQGPPRLLLHAGCGGSVVQRLACEQCGKPVAPEEIATAPGPGARTA